MRANNTDKDHSQSSKIDAAAASSSSTRPSDVVVKTSSDGNRTTLPNTLPGFFNHSSTNDVHDMPNPIDISQGVIIKKLSKFVVLSTMEKFYDANGDKSNKWELKRVEKKTLSTGREKAMSKGWCFGFSLAYAHMIKHNKSQWWKDVLYTITQWNEREDSLTEQVVIQGVEYRYGLLLEIAANYIMYNTADPELTSIPQYTQSNALNTNGLFLCEDGPIRFSANFTGYFDKACLLDLLGVVEDASPVNAVMVVQSCAHICAIHYDSTNQYWFLYDPNARAGEIRFPSKSALADEILTIAWHYLGHALTVRIASSESDSESPSLKAISDFQTKFYERNTCDLLRGSSLHVIVKLLEGYLSTIFDKAQSQSDVREALAACLLAKDHRDALGLTTLACDARDRLPAVIALAKIDANIRSSVVIWLSTEQARVNGQPGINFLANHAPFLLGDIIEMAKDNEDIRQVVSSWLSALRHGQMGFNFITNKVPMQLPIILELARNHGEMRSAVCVWLRHKFFGLSALEFLAKYAKQELTSIFEMARNHEEISHAISVWLSSKDIVTHETGLQSIQSCGVSRSTLEQYGIKIPVIESAHSHTMPNSSQQRYFI